MLVVGGDSYSCWPIEEFDGDRNRCWPNLVAKNQCIDLVDYTRSACSTDRIFRYCMPETLNQQNKIIVIFWSSYNRFEVGYQGKIEQIMPSFEGSKKIIPKEFLLKNYNRYLQHCRTLLYMISMQELCKKNNIIFLQKKGFRSDCWWNGTYENFVAYMKKAKIFDFLSDEQLEEKYRYLETLYTKIDSSTYVGDENLSLQDTVEFSSDFFHHPTYKGHEQMSEMVIDAINKAKCKETHHGKTF
jgi:hypothetical protein